MSDLINRQKMIDKMRRRKEVFCKNRIEFRALSMYEKARVDEIDNCISYLVNAPDAEPERKTGKWIDGMLYYDFDESEWEKVKCSVCENFVTKQIFYHDNKYHYCPYCGADMRGDHE